MPGKIRIKNSKNLSIACAQVHVCGGGTGVEGGGGDEGRGDEGGGGLQHLPS